VTWRWGKGSLEVRNEIDDRLMLICDQVLTISPFDLTLTEGRRGMEDQHIAFMSGASELDWPMSKHNAIEPEPSQAVHIEPYPIDYINTERYFMLAGLMIAVAESWDIRLRWLGLTTLRDLAHWEVLDV